MTVICQRNGMPSVTMALKSSGASMRQILGSTKSEIAGFIPCQFVKCERQADLAKTLLEPAAWAHSDCLNMPVTLAFIDSDNGKIILRRKNDEGDQRRIQNLLENFYFPLRHNDLRPAKVEPGDIVAVKVYRTQEWYRAQILQGLNHAKLGPSFRVVLLDKGRYTVISENNIKILTENLRRPEQLSLTVFLANFSNRNFTTEQRDTIQNYFQHHVLMKMTRVGAEENIPCAVELESKKSHAELGKLISENITLKNNEETKIPENTFLFKVSPFVSDNEKVHTGIVTEYLPELNCYHLKSTSHLNTLDFGSAKESNYEIPSVGDHGWIENEGKKYRVRVLTKIPQSEKFKALMIDHGNMIEIEKIAPLSKEMAGIAQNLMPFRVKNSEKVEEGQTLNVKVTGMSMDREIFIVDIVKDSFDLEPNLVSLENVEVQEN